MEDPIVPVILFPKETPDAFRNGNTTSSQKPLVPANQGQTSGNSTGSTGSLSDDLSCTSGNGSTTPVYQRTWFIVVVSVMGVIVLVSVAFLVLTPTRRTRRSNVRSESAFVPPMGSYKPIIMKDDGHGAEVGAPISQFRGSGEESGYLDPYS
ncbi:hypothetical protein BDP27DRAFT_1448395 [Rhodocollybia butyracea]|uniref:Uncharacterized protein n=1 Tax=Rhodocollybia butyracea TaxID=206335 RepID=A0A9P5PSD7_9AGAR|nr:hypothetical protein BDP27DRAFT_1448395 [Rhodocollybia butyracea]